MFDKFLTLVDRLGAKSAVAVAAIYYLTSLEMTVNPILLYVQAGGIVLIVVAFFFARRQQEKENTNETTANPGSADSATANG